MRTRKRFGQHFLEPVWCDKVVAAIAPAPGEQLLEIGAGLGALTRPLAAAGATILAIEIDRDLASRLRDERLPNLTVIEGDVLATWETVVSGLEGPVRVVGNLPYNISTPLLLRILAAGAAGRLSDATVMLQKEVAERVCAGPGGKTYGTLSVLASLAGRSSITLRLPRGAFRPPPLVESAVVRLEFAAAPSAAHQASERRFVAFADFVRDVFAHRRKTLVNAVRLARSLSASAAGEAIAGAALHPNVRPEVLTAGEFERLWSAVGRSGGCHTSSDRT